MNEPKILDLATLDTVAACDKGAEIELKHPVSKEPLGIFISCLGKDSQEFRSYMRERVNTDLRRAAVAQRRGKELPVQTVEQAEDRRVEMLVVCTQGWRTVVGKGAEAVTKPFIVLRGEELAFSVANAKKLYSAMPWIQQQVDEAIADLENFMKN